MEKDFKKEVSKSDDTFEKAVEAIIVLIIVYVLFIKVSESFSLTLALSRAEMMIHSSAGAVREVFLGLTTIAVFITIFFFMKWRNISNQEYRTYKARKPIKKTGVSRGIEWVNVIENVNSDNEANWRVAILEADRVLEKILTSNGYLGETLADQLKSIPDGRFSYLNSVWEAHKIRNAVAHQGLEYRLTSKETSRVIGLYESFFKEIGYL